MYNAHVNSYICIYYRFQWKKDSEALHDSLHIFSDQYTGVLTITKPTKTDFGTYECTATNKHGLAVSAAFKLKKACMFIHH